MLLSIFPNKVALRQPGNHEINFEGEIWGCCEKIEKENMNLRRTGQKIEKEKVKVRM